MISEQQQEVASLYALGALDGEASRAFEAELDGNAELRGLVNELGRVSVLLATVPPSPPLPSALREKVLARVASEASSLKPDLPPLRAALAGLRFDHSPSGAGWKALPVPGAFVKALSVQQERGYAILLGKLDPGSRYPAHFNVGPEDFLILTGDLVIGDRKLSAGDFHHADAGTQHEENHSVEGCTLIAVMTMADPLVAFAMA